MLAAPRSSLEKSQAPAPVPSSAVTRARVFWIAAHFIVCLGILILLDKCAFPGKGDGFTTGMYYLTSHPMAEWPGLVFVHAVRWIATSPMWLAHTRDWPLIFEAVPLLLFLLPIVLVPVGGARPSLWRVVILYMPCVFSYRATLASGAIAYLYLLLMTPWKPAWALVLSALQANLSSAVVILWLLMAGAGSSRLGKLRRTTVVLAMLLFLGLVVSIRQKLTFFSDPELAVDGSSAGSGEYGGPVNLFMAFKKAMSRSTIPWALKTGEWVRPMAYAGILLVLAGVIAYCVRREGWRGPNVRLFGLMLPGFLYEGLGVAACLISLILFALERHRLIVPRSVPSEFPEPAVTPAPDATNA